VEICISNNIDEEELVEVWMAFSVSHLGGANPTLDTLGQMERKEFGKKQEPQTVQKSRPQESTLIIYNGKESSSMESDFADDILNAYNTTPKAKNKFERKNEHTPDGRPTQGRSPRAVFSPASFSPTVATPSSKYKGRTNKGDIVCDYGEATSLVWRQRLEIDYKPQVKLLAPQMEVNTCYMFNKLCDVAQILEDSMNLLGEEIVSKNSLQEPQRVDKAFQGESIGMGRVCCDSNGRLNSKSLLLESSSGQTVAMDVSSMETYSLFPGQVIIMEGENPVGNKLKVKQVYCDAVLPLPQPPHLSTEESGPLQIVIASGPFTQSDTMTYQPLEDLIEYIVTNVPHVVILMGPFVDVTHPHIADGMLAETFQACFEKIVDSLMEPLKMLNVHVILVPSWQDAHHHMVYPVPPFILRKQYPNITLASDPCMLDIDGIVIGATATDILLHLGKEEISQVRPGSDRLGRLASHILYQRNFYPLYPSSEDVNLDMELWAKYAFLNVKPHILVLPSNLRCFIKNLDGCIAVNPERLAKGYVGGNFARLSVICKNGEVSVNGQIVKI
ncbi:hypothetical protein L9F63_009859, partial [Diploptera punctata]